MKQLFLTLLLTLSLSAQASDGLTPVKLNDLNNAYDTYGSSKDNPYEGKEILVIGVSSYIQRGGSYRPPPEMALVDGNIRAVVCNFSSDYSSALAFIGLFTQVAVRGVAHASAGNNQNPFHVSLTDAYVVDVPMSTNGVGPVTPAYELLREYTDNPMQASRKHNGKRIVISGIVSDGGILPDNIRVPHNNSERPYITLRTEGKVVNIACTFPSNREYAVMGLHNGQPVIIEGLLYTTKLKSGVRIWVTNSSIVKTGGAG